MGGEIYQAQVIRNFFDCITGTDRNLTRIYMCVMSLAKLRMEPPEKMTALVDQLRKSKIQKELSVDILDYMCDAANQLELQYGPDRVRCQRHPGSGPGLYRHQHGQPLSWLSSIILFSTIVENFKCAALTGNRLICGGNDQSIPRAFL